MELEVNRWPKNLTRCPFLSPGPEMRADIRDIRLVALPQSRLGANRLHPGSGRCVLGQITHSCVHKINSKSIRTGREWASSDRSHSFSTTAFISFSNSSTNKAIVRAPRRATFAAEKIFRKRRYRSVRYLFVSSQLWRAASALTCIHSGWIKKAVSLRL